MNNELILNMPVELTKSNARANAEQIIARVADGFANPPGSDGRIGIYRRGCKAGKGCYKSIRFDGGRKVRK